MRVMRKAAKILKSLEVTENAGHAIQHTKQASK
jgi:hypothetical protein